MRNRPLKIIIILFCLINIGLLVCIVFQSMALRTVGEEKEKAFKRAFDKKLGLEMKEMEGKYREETAIFKETFKNLESEKIKVKELSAKKTELEKEKK